MFEILRLVFCLHRWVTDLKALRITGIEHSKCEKCGARRMKYGA